MHVTIISDASYCHQSGAAGYGYWIAAERGKRGGGGFVRRKITGSIAAEMIAVVNSLAVALNAQLVQRGDHVLLQTDCQAAIDAFNNVRRNLPPNEREALSEFFRLKREHGFTYSFRHVKGHTSRPEARYVTNNLCDKRAKDGMRLARQAIAAGVLEGVEK